MRYSVTNFRRLDSYVSLVEKLLDFEGFGECFESNVYFGYIIRAGDLLTKLLSLHHLKESKCEEYKRRVVRNKENDWDEISTKSLRSSLDYSELLELIRSDDLDAVQQITSQPGFNLKNYYWGYEISNRVYTDKFVRLQCRSMINVSALFGSVRCFKYFMLNGDIIDDSTRKFAIFSDIPEIIHIIEHEGSSIHV